MPLLVSPMDGKTPMQQIARSGIEIDHCPVSGGVWLDRGELEKLLSTIQEDRNEYVAYRQQHPVQDRLAPQGRNTWRDEGYEDWHRKKHGKKSRLSQIFDIFD